MKKLFFISIILITSLFLFTGCNNSYSYTGQYSGTSFNESSSFVLLEEQPKYLIVYHKETKVMYVVSNDYYSEGVFELLVDENGLPLIYKD